MGGTANLMYILLIFEQQGKFVRLKLREIHDQLLDFQGARSLSIQGLQSLTDSDGLVSGFIEGILEFLIRFIDVLPSEIQKK